MLQCKIFSGSNPALVENEVNKFLGNNSKIMVHSILQSSDPTKMHVTVFFNVRTKALKMQEAAIAEVIFPVKHSELPTN